MKLPLLGNSVLLLAIPRGVIAEPAIQTDFSLTPEGLKIQVAVNTPVRKDDALMITHFCKDVIRTQPIMISSMGFSSTVGAEQYCTSVYILAKDAEDSTYNFTLGHSIRPRDATVPWRNLSKASPVFETHICPEVVLVQKHQTEELRQSARIVSSSSFELDGVDEEVQQDGNDWVVPLLTEARLMVNPNVSSASHDVVRKSCKKYSFSKQRFTTMYMDNIHREFYLPVWGDKVRVTDDYMASNGAPKPTSHFDINLVAQATNRYIGTLRSGPPVTISRGVIYSYPAFVPAGSVHHEFYDRIGNITTSEVLLNNSEGQIIVLYPRIPTAGHWKNSFSFRVHVPKENYMREDPDTGIVTVEIPYSPMVRDEWVIRHAVEVILPPFAKVVSVKSETANAGFSTTRVRQWLDLYPSRTVINVLYGQLPTSSEGALLTIQYKPMKIAAVASHIAWFSIPAVLFFAMKRIK